MALSAEQIETHMRRRSPGGESKSSGKEYKKQRNRKIRRSDKLEKPNIKYEGWEY